MDKVYFLLQCSRDYLEKNKKFLMDVILFPATILLNGQDEVDATYQDEDANKEKYEDMSKHLSEYSDEGNYKKEYEWGTLFMDVSDGIFQDIAHAVSEGSANISHDFAITAWVCSVHPEIMLDVEACIKGHHHLAIEIFIKKTVCS